MTDIEAPVRSQTIRLLVHGKAQGHATVLLYADKLAAVRLRAFGIRRFIGFIGFIVLFGSGDLIAAITHTALEGVLGAITAVAAGYLLRGPTESRAAAKVAAGGGDVTVIPLDLITRLETGKSWGRKGGQYLTVTTADGTEYEFGVKLDKWSADLANALTARGPRFAPHLRA